jgi:hypothetical protein
MIFYTKISLNQVFMAKYVMQLQVSAAILENFCVYNSERPPHTPCRQLWRHKVRAFVKARGIPRAV